MIKVLKKHLYLSFSVERIIPYEKKISLTYGSNKKRDEDFYRFLFIVAALAQNTLNTILILLISQKVFDKTARLNGRF